MKYRLLGKNGPRVSAISIGRGAQPIRFGDPLEQDFNAAVRRAYELGIAYVVYAPLGRGLLTGRIKSVEDLPEIDRRRRYPRFSPENLALTSAELARMSGVFTIGAGAGTRYRTHALRGMGI